MKISVYGETPAPRGHSSAHRWVAVSLSARPAGSCSSRPAFRMASATTAAPIYGPRIGRASGGLSSVGRGAQRPVHGGPSQARGGRDLRPVHVESRHAGTDGLQGVVVEVVRRGPWGRGDGLRHDCFISRRERGVCRPGCGSTAGAAVSIYGVSSAAAGNCAGHDPGGR